MALFKRHSRRRGYHLFDDLPLEAQREATWRYWRSCERWKGNLPSWLRPILIGQARRWAMTSPEERSRWGRSMLAKQGGYAVQRLYRAQGRVGEQHSLTVARRRKHAQASKRQQGTPLPKTKHKILPVW